MKKTQSVVCLFMLFFFAANCLQAAPPVPPEVKSFMLKFMKEMVVNNRAFSSAVEKVNDPGQMARAIDAYRQSITPLIEGMVALEEKYRDFFRAMDDQDEDAKTGDPDIDAAQDVFEKNARDFGATMMKVMGMMDKPEVQAAMERLEQLMSRLDREDEDSD